MAEPLTGNLLVAQAGGPSASANASLAGVITEALNQADAIEEIYGGLYGIQGVLQEELIDLAAESQQNIRGLRFTPGAALGSCRYPLKKVSDLERLRRLFEAHDIRYFLYIGGGDSMDTAQKIDAHMQETGWDVNVIGVPKAVDNDLAMTDHCPGYGSAAKFIATTVKELALDAESMGFADLVVIVEVMGRNAGWLAAASTLARGRDEPHGAPHLVYLPEVPFDPARYLGDVQRVLRDHRFCLVVCGEGLVDVDGNYLSASERTDGFGHAALGGAGDYLRELIEQNLRLRVRSVRLGAAERASGAVLSGTDVDEAYLVGQMAVRAAVDGETGKMVTLLRGDNEAYSCETGLVDLGQVANLIKQIPPQWINEDGVSLSFHYHRYAQPLIQGEVALPWENGTPKYIRLGRRLLTRRLEPYVAD